MGQTWSADDPWDPRNPENRDRTRVLQRELRQRLLAWDPIGLADAPEAQDEYDCLISPLMHRLHQQASARDLGDWLISEMNEHFGMTADDERERRLATELLTWWNAATGRPPS